MKRQLQEIKNMSSHFIYRTAFSPPPPISPFCPQCGGCLEDQNKRTRGSGREESRGSGVHPQSCRQERSWPKGSEKKKWRGPRKGHAAIGKQTQMSRGEGGLQGAPRESSATPLGVHEKHPARLKTRRAQGCLTHRSECPGLDTRRHVSLKIGRTWAVGEGQGKHPRVRIQASPNHSKWKRAQTHGSVDMCFKIRIFMFVPTLTVELKLVPFSLHKKCQSQRIHFELLTVEKFQISRLKINLM